MAQLESLFNNPKLRELGRAVDGLLAASASQGMNVNTGIAGTAYNLDVEPDRRFPRFQTAVVVAVDRDNFEVQCRRIRYRNIPPAKDNMVFDDSLPITCYPDFGLTAQQFETYIPEDVGDLLDEVPDDAAFVYVREESEVYIVSPLNPIVIRPVVVTATEGDEMLDVAEVRLETVENEDGTESMFWVKAGDIESVLMWPGMKERHYKGLVGGFDPRLPNTPPEVPLKLTKGSQVMAAVQLGSGWHVMQSLRVAIKEQRQLKRVPGCEPPEEDPNEGGGG